MAKRALDEKLALELLEQGASLAPLDKAILLVAALDGLGHDEAADLAIDDRDRRLIEHWIESFGTKVALFARCPHCNEAHEAEFDLAALPTSKEQEVEAVVAGKNVALRAPTSREVAAAVLDTDPNVLLRACVTPSPSRATRRYLGEVEVRLSEAFPLLDIRVEMVCAACERLFSSRFDITAWLWGRLLETASRALDAVDRIARAYGWSEDSILALSPARRQFYLNRLSGA